MDYNKKNIVAMLIALTFVMVLALPVLLLEANKSNLRFGGDKGNKVVWKACENLAYKVLL